MIDERGAWILQDTESEAPFHPDAPQLRGGRTLDDLSSGDLVLDTEARVVLRVTEVTAQTVITEDGRVWTKKTGAIRGTSDSGAHISALTDEQSRRFLHWSRLQRVRRQLTDVIAAIDAITPDDEVADLAVELNAPLERASELLETIG
ncbi:hypothetical protein [Pseudoclavibacter soli]|uniref:hypothetical protein n=1 Tax=Pseudoclavibacter soli TaxID=452623 RepID=UPI000415C399|nr:hypothetical protein [Pseudoclavibacter soli]